MADLLFFYVWVICSHMAQQCYNEEFVVTIKTLSLWGAVVSWAYSPCISLIMGPRDRVWNTRGGYKKTSELQLEYKRTYKHLDSVSTLTL